ncbi:MAG: MarR family transcriptional regulator [Massilia sp.]|jgi:DNA-binding MarR family transcriptional regulator
MTKNVNVPLRTILERVSPAKVAGSTEEFLHRLLNVDLAGLTVRDALALYVIQAQPGISGLDLAHMVGQPHRSGVQSNIHRLIDRGLIEDRRERSKKAIPSLLYVLPAGVELWKTLIV